MTDDGVPTIAALDAALARVGDRWSLLVVAALLEEASRFTELAAAIPGIAPNILTDRLRRLERDGIVVARRYQERPARLAYTLSEEGRELAGVLRLLAAWGGATRGSGPETGLRHAVCGTQLEPRWYCATCGRSVEDDDTDELRYA